MTMNTVKVSPSVLTSLRHDEVKDGLLCFFVQWGNQREEETHLTDIVSGY